MLVLLFIALSRGNGKVAVGKVDVDILLVHTGQLYLHFIALVALFDVGAHILVTFTPPAVKCGKEVAHGVLEEIVIAVIASP